MGRGAGSQFPASMSPRARCVQYDADSSHFFPSQVIRGPPLQSRQLHKPLHSTSASACFRRETAASACYPTDGPNHHSSIYLSPNHHQTKRDGSPNPSSVDRPVNPNRSPPRTGPTCRQTREGRHHQISRPIKHQYFTARPTDQSTIQPISHESNDQSTNHHTVNRPIKPHHPINYQYHTTQPNALSTNHLNHSTAHQSASNEQRAINQS